MGDREQPKWRVPAVDLEEIVIGQLVGILRDREALAHRHNISPDQLHGLFADYEDQAQRLATGSPQDQSELIRDLVERIVVDQDRIVIIACLRRQAHRGPVSRAGHTAVTDRSVARTVVRHAERELAAVKRRSVDRGPPHGREQRPRQ